MASPRPTSPAPLPAPNVQEEEPLLPSLESAYQPTLYLVETEADVAEMVAHFRTSGARFLSLDCEANGKDARTAIPLLLQLTTQDDEAFELHLQDCPNLGQLWEWVRAAGITVMGHNISYDYKLLRVNNFVPRLGFGKIYDTQLAELMLTTGKYSNNWLKAVSLKSVLARYLQLDMSKDTRLTFTEVTPELAKTWRANPEQLTYGALDIVPLDAIRSAQMPLLRQEGLTKALQLRFDAVMSVAEMELRGMLIDQQTWRTYLTQVEAEREQKEAELIRHLAPYELAYQEQKLQAEQATLRAWEQARDAWLELIKADWEQDNEGLTWGKYKTQQMQAWRKVNPRPVTPPLLPPAFNLNSSQQKLRALQALGLKLDQTNKLARDKVLRGKVSDDQREVLRLTEEFGKLNQIRKNFGENTLKLIDPVTGKLHGHFNIHVAETGRWSSSAPNFQNFPRVDAIRHAFIAPPGMSVITADYTGQELVIAAAMSGDLQMRLDLLKGKDLYKEVASSVWHIPPEEVTKEQRAKAKSALLGINYGLSAAGMEEKNGIPLVEAKKLLEAVRGKYPSVVEMGDAFAKQALTKRYVQTVMGTKRYFTDENMPLYQFNTRGRNMPVQGTAAEVGYRLSYRAEVNLVPKGVYPVNFVHDEVVALVDTEHAEEGRDLLVAEMQAAFNDILPEKRFGMTIKVDAHIAPYWTKE